MRQLSRAERADEQSARRIDALKQAFAIEPMNSDTAYQVGEQLRRISFRGDSGYKKAAQEAMSWLERAIRLNRYDPFAHTGYGMCLDWIGEQDKAAEHFKAALAMDPNHYYTRAMMAWHEFQVGNIKAAHDWSVKSVAVNADSNPIGWTYLFITEKRLNETNK